MLKPLAALVSGRGKGKASRVIVQLGWSHLNGKLLNKDHSTTTEAFLLILVQGHFYLS